MTGLEFKAYKIDETMINDASERNSSFLYLEAADRGLFNLFEAVTDTFYGLN